jgi:hypothetical protein
MCLAEIGFMPATGLAMASSRANAPGAGVTPPGRMARAGDERRQARDE